jgi:hypothetical protein
MDGAFAGKWVAVLKSGGVQNGDGTVNEYYEHL